MSLHPNDIKREARRLGFDLCGIASAEAFPELAFFRTWLDRGYAATMGYLERTAERRSDVRNVLPSAQSVIVTGTVYNTERPYSTEVVAPGRGEVARYAWGDDYHAVIGKRLESLVRWMRDESCAGFDAAWYVDTGPVQERAYAQRAGIGWIGKNTCLISPELGSWLFLAEVIVSLALEPDEPAFDHCGTCRLCLDACPTCAFPEPGVLDSSRCISYHTIELKGAIPEADRDEIGNHVYGCDICQEVCPWNMRPAVSDRPEWQPREQFDRPALADLWLMPDERLRAAMHGSAMTRAKLAGIRRNVAVAIGNSGQPALAEVFGQECEPRGAGASPSREDPMVREHVEWARRKLEPSR